MPYIKPEDRAKFDRAIKYLGRKLSSAGELNYVITRLIFEGKKQQLKYADIALITGVLENVKQEFYRRAAAPYEDKKIVENGDVYE